MCTMSVNHLHLKFAWNAYLQLVLKLRLIIHDWADAEASTILRNVRKAMAPHSRVLIRMCSLSSIPEF